MRTVTVSYEGFGFKRGELVVVLVRWDHEIVGQINASIKDWIFHGILPAL